MDAKKLANQNKRIEDMVNRLAEIVVKSHNGVPENEVLAELAAFDEELKCVEGD